MAPSCEPRADLPARKEGYSRGFPEEDADLFVEVGEEVGTGLMHDVRAEVLSDHHVP